MRVAANLARQTRRFAVVVLPQLQPVPSGGLHQMFPAAFQQARIARMGNRLLHHRRIDDHALQTRVLADLGPFGRLDRLRQPLFDANFTKPLVLLATRLRTRCRPDTDAITW
ncbi:hypothetical protein WJ33_11190 [Burkholderia ubonensis]|uniref:Uncharacterized protein n=1 Tax=Burkholderia ubonensis TaxID=101571 RepID=A0A103QLR4_9BURK|nr:hypothetical protein WJ33_11190 [Burkholderia ubonensis]